LNSQKIESVGFIYSLPLFYVAPLTKGGAESVRDMRARYVLSALLGVFLVVSMLPVAAQPPQAINVGPVSIPTSAEEFETMFPGVYGKVVALALFVIVFMGVRKLFFEDKRGRSEGIVGWGVPFLAALLTTVIIGPSIVGMVGITPAVTGPSTTCSITGPIEVRVLDKVSGAAITSGKVYLLEQAMSIEKVIDSDIKGNLTAPVRTPDSSGIVRFDNVKPGTYMLAYLPSSYAVGSYMPTLATITISCAFKPNSDLLVASISAMEIYKIVNLNFVNEVGTIVTSYTWKPSSYPAELSGLTVWLKPAATDGASPYFYIYVNFTDTVSAPVFKVGGSTIAPTKLSDLPGTDPLRLNAPSGYLYVLKVKNEGLFGQDTKKPIEISGTFQGDETVKMKIVFLAESERGDIAGPTFTLTVDDAASSPGWGSS